MNPVEIKRGDSPVVLGIPHTGLYVPDEIRSCMNETGLALADTDWHVHELYDGLLAGATAVRATFHRYVIDANRDPSGDSLYPGQNTTGLCPLTDFDGDPVYRPGTEPDEADTADRLRRFHQPYHQALRNEIDRVKARHGIVVLYDCHSIRSQIPFLFEGVLPDFNIGTNDGRSCATEIGAMVAEICANAEGYTSVLNGRFKGGWTTRHYGQPGSGVHAIQMELAQITHLASEAAPFDVDQAKFSRLRPHLQSILKALEEWAFSQIT